MSAIKFFKHLHLAYLSQPAGERTIYQTVRKLRPTRIVELGVGTGERTERMLRLAVEMVDCNLQYTGVDLFEGRSDKESGMSLKDAHRRFSTARVKTRLAPGDVLSVVTRMANALTDTDLLLVSADHESQLMEAAWYYVPRMLHENSIVLRGTKESEAGGYKCVPLAEVDRLAAAAYRPARAAA